MKKIIIWLSVVVMIILGYDKIAISDGALPTDPRCQNLPDPTSGPFIEGTFSIAYDKVDQTNKHYNCHVVLKANNQVHLFSFPISYGGRNICTYSPWEFMEKYKGIPCTLGVENAFKMKGIPVITDMRIKNQDSCGNINLTEPWKSPSNPDAMIYGEIKITVVPK